MATHTITTISAAIAEQHGITKIQAKEIVELTFYLITAALKEGERVQIHQFGSFQRKDYAARLGRNPKTGEVAHVAARHRATFKQAPAMKAKFAHIKKAPKK